MGDSLNFYGDEVPSLHNRPSQDYMAINPKYEPHKGLVRYSQALKHLIPIRKANERKNVIGIDNAGFFSFMTFSWITPYIWKAYKRGLSIDDVPLGSQYDACDINSQRLEMIWEEEIARKGPKSASLGYAIWRFAKTRLLLSCFTFSISCLMGFLSPTIFMRKLLECSENEHYTWRDGLIWAAALSLADLLRMLFFSLCWGISYRTAARLRAACLTMVYRKVMRLHSMGHKSSGEILNLFANDGPRLFYMIVFGPMIIGGPLVAICGVIYIYSVLGPWPLLGMLVFLLYYPVQYGLSHLTGYFRGRAIKVADQRVKHMTELLSSIKFIKMYAWEDVFTNKVQKARREEVAELRKTALCQSLGLSLAPTMPVFASIVTFVAHVLAGGNLTASQAFPVLTFTSKMLRMALKHLTESCNTWQMGIIALPRLKELLLMEELQVTIGKPKDKDIAVEIINGTFLAPSHQNVEEEIKENEEKEKLNSPDTNEGVPLLSDVTISIKKGTLVGVCGVVGAGKSSLLQSFLGQLKMSAGNINRDGSVAFVSQQSWIQNATLKENILFGEQFNAQRYINTVHCCALNDDIHLLPGGDETEIGEKGVNLSGGQKQRVSLARALYSQRDIYFLDDPLSAVDAQVGAHILEHAILGALKSRTVVFVTHQVAHLAVCDNVIVVKEGRVIAQGSHQQLLEESRDYRLIVQASEFSEINLKGGGESSESRPTTPKIPLITPIISTKDSVKKKAVEEQLRGEVRSYAYKAYFRAAGLIACLLGLITIFINSGINAFSSYWLAYWIQQGGGNTTVVDPVTNETIPSADITDNPDLPWFLGVYAGIVGLIVMISIIRPVAVTGAFIRAGRRLHDALFTATIGTTMAYFETTPVGRILNLFATDLDEVEGRLPVALETMVQNIWEVAFSFLFITIVFPWFIVPLIILSIFYYCISRVFRVAVRDFQRMDSISRAPILSAISTSINGLSTIHAFGKEGEFFSVFTKIFDENSTCLIMNCYAMRWLATRLDSISVTITCVTALFTVGLKGQVPAALAGLALSYAARISGVFQYTIRLMSETEQRFISVERMQTSIQKLAQEGRNSHLKSPPGWPSKGSIRFKDVTMSYGENLPPVLNSFSLKIRGGEKLGVVGRTGAGKSSLITALFRLCEVSTGSIQIDDIDISRLQLRELRRAMAVIPQDPVLFGGSFRANLDPYGKHSDEVLWNAVDKTNLSKKVRSIDGGLDGIVGEGGDCLSIGERQLVCLARALLRGCKILVLDEATASVDPETEQAIQQTIRNEFAACTVITIAHRLATVTSSDRVLLMDHGEVVELDDPSVLLDNRKSHFAQLAAAVGFIPNP